MEKRFETRLEGFKRKARQLSTLCDVDICLVVFGSGSQTPTAIWPDGAQIGKAENTGRRYLGLPPKQPTSDTGKKRGGEYDDQELYDRLGGFSEEGLRDLARVLEGKLEEAKKKMEAGHLPRPRRPGQGPVRKRAKVGESVLQVTPATPGAMVSFSNGMINGGSVNGCVLDDRKKVEEACLFELPERGPGVEAGNLCPVAACDSGTGGMVSCPFPAMVSTCTLASWCWPDNSTFMEMLMCDDDDDDADVLEIEALWCQD